MMPRPKPPWWHDENLLVVLALWPVWLAIAIVMWPS